MTAHAARPIASCIVVTQTRASAIVYELMGIQQETSMVLFSHSVLTRGILNTNRRRALEDMQSLALERMVAVVGRDHSRNDRAKRDGGEAWVRVGV